jgi:hypothetical protein
VEVGFTSMVAGTKRHNLLCVADYTQLIMDDVVCLLRI